MKIYFYENEIQPVETDKIEGEVDKLVFTDKNSGEKFELTMNEIDFIV